MKKPFKLYKSDDGQFYFVVMAANGKVLVTSETYTRKRNALGGIASLWSIFYDAQQLPFEDGYEDLT